MEYHYKIDPKNGKLILIDKNLIKNQKGVIKDVLKNFSFSTDFQTFSLPIRIFKTENHMDHYSMIFGNLQYIEKAHKSINKFETDPEKIKFNRLKRLKNIVSYILGGLIHVSASRKPCNHYLGETFQATYDDGTKIYVERIKHSKPTETFLFVNQRFGFKLYGTIRNVSKFLILTKS